MAGDTTSGLLRVNADLSIPLAEIEWRFGPSGGPGGQHANRAHTRADARFDVESSPSLTSDQRARLLDKLGAVLRVVVDEERSQARNREVALERLAARLDAALYRPTRRRATKPSRAAEQRRLDAKRQRSETKQARRPPRAGED